MATPGSPSTRTPVLTDAKSCDAWLATAALVDPRQACQELTGVLGALEIAPPPAPGYLEILERLREPIAIALAEHSRKFASRPLPLRDAELAAFEQVFNLWNAVARAYRQLLYAALGNSAADPARRIALIAQRALEAQAEIVLMHFRARREVDGGLWRDLHDLYRVAVANEVVREPVPVKSGSSSTLSAQDVYVRTLLLDLAHPDGLTPRDLQWTRRWSSMWAHKVELGPMPDGTEGYAVELAGDRPPSWIPVEDATPTTRFLGMRNVRKSVRGRIKKLGEGATPESLGLGKDTIQPDAGRLLVQLNRDWLEAPAARLFIRRPVMGKTDLVSGFESTHAAIAGRVFRSASRHWDYSRRDAEQIAIYGGVAEAAAAGQAGFEPEKWETLDESATGFKLRRKGPGERLSHRQLVGLKPEGARGYILSEIRWLSLSVDGALTIGARALPGLAAAAAVRPPWPGHGAPENFMQAFVLPGNPGSTESIVLPSGWFQAGRELELKLGDEVSRIRLQSVVQHGYDFDRVSYATVG